MANWNAQVWCPPRRFRPISKVYFVGYFCRCFSQYFFNFAMFSSSATTPRWERLCRGAKVLSSSVSKPSQDPAIVPRSDWHFTEGYQNPKTRKICKFPHFHNVHPKIAKTRESINKTHTTRRPHYCRSNHCTNRSHDGHEIIPSRETGNCPEGRCAKTIQWPALSFKQVRSLL